MPHKRYEDKLAYMKARYRKDPEARRAASRAYYASNAAARKACVAAYRKANKEKVAASQKASYAKAMADPTKREAKKKYWRDWHADNKSRYLPRARVRKGYPTPTRECPRVCECCGSPPAVKSLALDHCHETHAFRGWLCASCNLGIGKLGDSTEGVLRALVYLLKAENNNG